MTVYLETEPQQLQKRQQHLGTLQWPWTQQTEAIQDREYCTVGIVICECVAMHF